jgi:hypothetical protein
MTHFTNTYQVTGDLDNFLKDNNYFDGGDEAVVNQKIFASWNEKFKSAIIADIKSKFDDIEVDFISSEFELSSADNKGGCLFFHRIVISDKINLEFVKCFIKTLVNYNKTTIYLDSIYATVDKWQGKSKNLKVIFDKLKTADKKFGYFNPTSLTDFVK